MTRRDFILTTSAATGFLFFPAPRAQAHALVPIVIGALVIAGGLWAGYEIRKWAKEKLYPCPKVPGGTNNVPPIPPLHPPNTKSAMPAAQCMGHLKCDDGVIHSIDVEQMTGEELSLNTLPDGTQAFYYATMPVKGSVDLKTWSPLGTLEVWFNAVGYVMKFGDQVEQGTGEPPFVTVRLSPVAGSSSFFDL